MKNHVSADAITTCWARLDRALGGLDIFFAAKGAHQRRSHRHATQRTLLHRGTCLRQPANQAAASHAGRRIRRRERRGDPVSSSLSFAGVHLRFHGVCAICDQSGWHRHHGLDRLAVGANSAAWLSGAAGDSATTTYDLNVAVAAPSFSGTGVFLNPVGVVNAASLAPAGSPVAPGEYISLFGTNLAPAMAQAGSFPIPKTLGSVGVTVNGIAAPLNYVSPNQINLLVPFAATGSTATIVVTNSGTPSNSVSVPLAATAPGIFTQDGSGANLGVVLHANYTLVNGAAPATANEVVLIYMTGLGAVNPPVGDGAQGPSAPNLALVTATFSVLIDNQPATISYQGLAPTFAGLYQLNVTVPAAASKGPNVPLAISTNQAFLDQVSIAIH